VFGIPGILLCGLGLFVGVGFALPALGMNTLGPNSVGFTVAAECVAGAVYFLGAVMSWLAAATIRKGGYRVLHIGYYLVFLVLLLAALMFRGSSGDWTSVFLVLVFTTGLLLPWLIGLRPQWPPVARRD
jgi:hypothetical protein